MANEQDNEQLEGHMMRNLYLLMCFIPAIFVPNVVLVLQTGMCIYFSAPIDHDDKV